MIDPAIKEALESLEDQVEAASPLQNADQATIKALQLNAENLVVSVQDALDATGTLDGWQAPIDAPTIISGFNDIVEQATDESTLSLLRGIVGRAASNLEQL